MRRHLASRIAAAVLVILTVGPVLTAQTNFPPEEFNAVAIVNNNVATGAGRIIIRVSRWSAVAERDALVATLLNKGPAALLGQLRKEKPVGSIRTPDSLAYDLRYAFQRPAPEGGREIVIATDRPIGFWESWHQPRTVDYPFTVIQIQMPTEGKGKGTMWYATKIQAADGVISLENFASAPVMLTEIESQRPR